MAVSSPVKHVDSAGCQDVETQVHIDITTGTRLETLTFPQFCVNLPGGCSRLCHGWVTARA